MWKDHQQIDWFLLNTSLDHSLIYRRMAGIMLDKQMYEEFPVGGSLTISMGTI